MSSGGMRSPGGRAGGYPGGVSRSVNYPVTLFISPADSDRLDFVTRSLGREASAGEAMCGALAIEPQFDSPLDRGLTCDKTDRP